MHEMIQLGRAGCRVEAGGDAEILDIDELRNFGTSSSEKKDGAALVS